MLDIILGSRPVDRVRRHDFRRNVGARFTADQVFWTFAATGLDAHEHHLQRRDFLLRVYLRTSDRRSLCPQTGFAKHLLYPTPPTMRVAMHTVQPFAASDTQIECDAFGGCGDGDDDEHVQAGSN